MEADSASELPSWLGPGGKAISRVCAKLDADIGGGRRGDDELGDLDVVGGGDLPRSNHVHRRAGGFSGIGFARRSDRYDEALRARWSGVIAGGIDRSGWGAAPGPALVKPTTDQVTPEASPKAENCVLCPVPIAVLCGLMEIVMDCGWF